MLNIRRAPLPEPKGSLFTPTMPVRAAAVGVEGGGCVVGLYLVGKAVLVVELYDARVVLEHGKAEIVLA